MNLAYCFWFRGQLKHTSRCGMFSVYWRPIGGFTVFSDLWSGGCLFDTFPLSFINFILDKSSRFEKDICFHPGLIIFGIHHDKHTVFKWTIDIHILVFFLLNFSMIKDSFYKIYSNCNQPISLDYLVWSLLSATYCYNSNTEKLIAQF